jgi:hypothetical protein
MINTNKIDETKLRVQNNEKLGIYCWNANSISNKIDELNQFLNLDKVDIIAINETKLSKLNECFLKKNENYNAVFKSRNGFGGGVAFFVKKDIQFEIIDDLDKFEVEQICIKIRIKNKYIFIITYYNPPDKDLNIDMLNYLDEKFENYIICGDFNSKNTSFGCKVNNKNGTKLEEFILNSKALILNNKVDPTYYRTYNNYQEILDLFICSNSLFRLIDNFKVLNHKDLGSDHFPIKIEMRKDNVPSKIKKDYNTPKFDYAKANWGKFKEYLNNKNLTEILNSKNVDEINEFVIQNMIEAAEVSIPKKQKHTSNVRIPKYLLEIIKLRRRYKKALLKNYNEIDKKKYYDLSKIIKEELTVIKNRNWDKFSSNFSKNPTSSKIFWDRIKRIKTNNNDVSDKYPKLILNGREYCEDIDKANLFGEILSKTFKDESDACYDDVFKYTVSRDIEEYNKIMIEENKKSNLGFINVENMNKYLYHIKHYA